MPWRRDVTVLLSDKREPQLLGYRGAGQIGLIHFHNDLLRYFNMEEHRTDRCSSRSSCYAPSRATGSHPVSNCKLLGRSVVWMPTYPRTSSESWANSA